MLRNLDPRLKAEGNPQRLAGVEVSNGRRGFWSHTLFRVLSM
jgi:hypothetical protein